MTAEIKTEPVTTSEEPDFAISSPKRVKLPDDLDTLSKETLVTLWTEQDKYIDHIETIIKELESKPKGPDSASKREHLLVVRLATKDQEIQELTNQIAELKAAQVPTPNALKNSLIDPAINLIIIKLKKELEAVKTKFQETQEELSAWKFTPDSVTGKRLMSKCRQLLQENEEIGKMISSGRLAKLEGELAMQKNLCEEMKKNQSEMDDFVQELDEDVEGMQSTIYLLQQQLKEAKETIANLSKTNAANQKQKQEQQQQQQQEEERQKQEEKERVEENAAEVEPPERVQETEVNEAQPMEQEDSSEAKKDNDEVQVPEKPASPEPIVSAPTEPVVSLPTETNTVESPEKEVADGEEDQALSLRTTRRGRATPTKSSSESPNKRGRATRGQKREPEEDDGGANPDSLSPGRPKRRRAAPQRFNEDLDGKESKNENEISTEENEEEK